ncbi:MAG TPA: GNAT family protein [Mycobacteriales bacterium]|nr:GNAT family protein [Mycobacteriales bacterium]
MADVPVAPDGRPLVASAVRLDRATRSDAVAIFAALDDDRVWEMGFGGSMTRPTGPEGWAESIDKAAAEDRVMYVVRLTSDDRVVGTSSIGDIDVVHEKAHIGWTAYSPMVWQTAVNPECKLLLLTHCFEDCALGRVKLRTDLINVRSQAAIAKLGATREGVARRHLKRADGTWRDSVIYSVIIDDWPAVKAGLEARLAAPTIE